MSAHCCDDPRCACETESDAHAACDCPAMSDTCANADCCRYCHGVTLAVGPDSLSIAREVARRFPEIDLPAFPDPTITDRTRMCPDPLLHEMVEPGGLPFDVERLVDVLDSHYRIEITGDYGSHKGWECDCGGWDSRHSTIRWSEHVADNISRPIPDAGASEA